MTEKSGGSTSAKYEPGQYLCALSDLEETGAVGYAPDEPLSDMVRPLPGIIVVQSGEEVRAYLNKCPHIGTPLEMFPNRFLDETRSELICTTHGARFNVDDGACIFGPCKGEALRPVEIRVDEGNIYLQTAPLKE